MGLRNRGILGWKGKGNLVLRLDQLRRGGVIHGERARIYGRALVPLLEVLVILVILVVCPRRQVIVERVK